MKKQDIKISIIVPVYNVAPYLARCLDSLIGQTLHDIEIICIDDKSTDNSLEILHEYRNKDPRIQVIALDKNSGVSTARNTGIEAARGEYLGFVDSDDYVDTDFYEHLYAKARADNADIVHGGVKITAYDGSITTDTTEIKGIEKYGKWYFSWQWWAAIYRTDMIRNAGITFPSDIISGEDTVFLIKSTDPARSISLAPNTFYHYVRREGSLDERVMSEPKIKSRIKALMIVAESYNTANISMHDYVARYAWAMGGLYSHFHKNTTAQCRYDVTSALVQLYRNCKAKAKISKKLGEIFGTNAIACLQSFDTTGLFECLAKETPAARVLTQKDTFLLFGTLPLGQIIKTPERFIIRFCGIQILKIKPKITDFRMWILYIPIIRKKRKYK